MSRFIKDGFVGSETSDQESQEEQGNDYVKISQLAGYKISENSDLKLLRMISTRISKVIDTNAFFYSPDDAELVRNHYNFMLAQQLITISICYS